MTKNLYVIIRRYLRVGIMHGWELPNWVTLYYIHVLKDRNVPHKKVQICMLI